MKNLFTKEKNQEKLILMYQSVKSEDIDYFYQLKDSDNLTLENINDSFANCALENVSWDFALKLIGLGANNFTRALKVALTNRHYVFAEQLFTVQRYINIFTIHFSNSHDYSPEVIALVSSIDTLSLFKHIIYSIPNHTQSVSTDKVYARGFNENSLNTYDYVFNQLLKELLILTIGEFRSGRDVDNMYAGLQVLAQRSFRVNAENITLLDEIVHPQFKMLFARRLTGQNQTPHIEQDYIEDVDDEFYCTNMAQGQLLNRLFFDNGHEQRRQKFRVYLRLARYLNIPPSLNQTMWQAMCRNWLYQKRLPDNDEYQALKMLDNSVINHQKLVALINRYVHYDKARLYEKLDESLVTQVNDMNTVKI